MIHAARHLTTACSGRAISRSFIISGSCAPLMPSVRCLLNDGVVMKEKAKTILLALLTPKSIVLGLTLCNFTVIWIGARSWGESGLICYLCPWYYPWSFTNEPTRLLLAACGLCLSMKWSYLAAIGLSGFTLFEGASWYSSILHDGLLVESWLWLEKLDLHTQYLLASVIFVYAAACFSKSAFGCASARNGI